MPTRQAKTEALVHWEQHGNVSVWRYAGNARGFDGWHVTADADGGRSLLALIDLLTEANDVSLYRTLKVMHPTPAILRVPNHRDVPVIAPARWRLRYAQDHEDWSLVADGDVLECVLGQARMKQMRASVEAMLRGDGDFAIGTARKRRPDRHLLWFWWWPKAQS